MLSAEYVRIVDIKINTWSRLFANLTIILIFWLNPG